MEVIPRAKELYGVYRKATKEEKKELLTLAERLRSVREVAQSQVILDLPGGGRGRLHATEHTADRGRKETAFSAR